MVDFGLNRELDSLSGMKQKQKLGVPLIRWLFGFSKSLRCPLLTSSRALLSLYTIKIGAMIWEYRKTTWEYRKAL